jgi:PIN domain nuclease of toxin-antitoxin system
MIAVLDTSALIYWTLDPAKLTAPAQAEIARANRLLVSAISIWEIGLKAQRGKLHLPLSIEAYAVQLQRVEKVEIVAVDVEIWLANLALDWTHRDPADRTIVATAVRHEAALVTSDEAMRRFYGRAVW